MAIKNLTNQIRIFSQNNTLQLHATGWFVALSSTKMIDSLPKMFILGPFIRQISKKGT
jgi:hypothetical protein